MLPPSKLLEFLKTWSPYVQEGQSDKALEYFERALSLENRMEGFDRSYILYNFGVALEKIFQVQKAVENFQEACDLNFEPACMKLNDPV